MALNREGVIRSAEKYVARGKLEAAIKEYRKVLKEFPNDANTLNRVGDLYARIERIDEAVKLFSQIAEQYTRDGFFVKAIAIYKKIIKLDPTSLMVYERLAELYYKQGLLNEARTQYQVLADYYQKHDNAASAIGILQRMAEMEPDNPTYHLKLAELYTSQRLIDKALREYRQLADLLIVGGSVDEAVQVYAKALEIGGAADLGFVRQVVKSLHDGGHVGAAAQVLARAAEREPAAAALARELGLTPTADTSERAETAPAEPEAAPPAEVDDTFDLPDSTFDELDLEVEAATATEDDAPSSFDGGSFDGGSFDGGSFDGGSFDEGAYEPAPVAPPAADADEFVFELEGFDDEVPETLVQPPADLLAADAAAAADAASETAAHLDADDSFTFDLDGDEEPDTLVKPPPDMAGGAADAAGDGLDDSVEIEWGMDEIEIEVELDATAAGTVAGSAAASAAAEPPAVHRDEDLLAEARVFSKYGLLEKAQDRLSDLLAVRPRHLEGLRLMVELELDGGDLEAASRHAATLADAAREAGDLEHFWALRDRLEAAGLELPDVGEVAPAPAPEAEEELPELVFEEPEEDAPSPQVAPPEPEVEEPSPPAAAEAPVEERRPVESASPPPASTAPPTSPATAEIELPAAPAKPRKPSSTARIAQLLEDLSLGDFEAPRRRPRSEAAAAPPVSAPASAPSSPPASSPPPAADDDADAFVAGVEATLAAEAAEPPPAVSASVSPPAPAPPPAAAPPRSGMVDLADELGLDELDDELEDVLRPPARGAAPPAMPPEPTAVDLDETGMSWLDDVADSSAASGEDEAIFDEEDDFFDLASELERELSDDDGSGALDVDQPREQSLEEIIEGFKQGVAENLSPEDYDTHFNLGIAYREMGLLDEAIGEFQLASKDSRYLVEASSMLGLCFLEKGLPELAVRWYRKGLEAPEIGEDKTLGLLYDMGSAYVTLGDGEAAYKTFVEIYGMNSNYRDVSARLSELRAG